MRLQLKAGRNVPTFRQCYLLQGTRPVLYPEEGSIAETSVRYDFLKLNSISITISKFTVTHDET